MTVAEMRLSEWFPAHQAVDAVMSHVEARGRYPHEVIVGADVLLLLQDESARWNRGEPPMTLSADRPALWRCPLVVSEDDPDLIRVTGRVDRG